ncbi:thioesterase family protein [Phaeobacter sp. NW0010-22]|uniref:acyl-CoA thioesterase n=1 Tax=Phaeobacter sp. NW0010-22 TaxID=3135907 RepID=UPI00310C01BA
MSAPISWDFPVPFTVVFDVQPDDIDAYDHVNNTVYLRWIDAIAWAHSDAAGMTTAYCQSIGKGFAVHRHEIDYLRPAHLGDQVHVSTWIVKMDGKLRSDRRFQIVREQTGETLVRARTEYICTDLKSGRPTRIPDAFKTAYRVDPRIQEAVLASEQ